MDSHVNKVQVRIRANKQKEELGDGNSYSLIGHECMPRRKGAGGGTY